MITMTKTFKKVRFDHGKGNFSAGYNVIYLVTTIWFLIIPVYKSYTIYQHNVS